MTVRNTYTNDHLSRRLALAVAAAMAAVSAGCGEFEVRSIVLDLRVLGASVEPPEVVTPFDPDNPANVELEDTVACALVADPADTRRLTYTMRACAPTLSDRCDEPGRPVVNMGTATAADPEQADAPVAMCQTLPADSALLAVLLDSIEDSAVSGFGGVRVQIELSVAPEDGSEEPQFATKQMLYSPKIPEERVANTNPGLAELKVTRADGEETALPLGRCNEVEPLTVSRGEELEIEPIEAEGTREDYVVPTFSGGSRMFTEYMTYSWYSTHGSWGSEVTGGPRDVAGNPALLDTTWRAGIPSEEVGDGVDVRMWIVQQDERGGLTWYDSCVRIAP